MPMSSDPFQSDAVARVNATVQSRILYPELARRMGWQGEVKLRTEIGTKGHAIRIQLVRHHLCLEDL